MPAKMLTIRKASREDSLHIARVHKSAVEAIGPGYYSPDELSAWATPRDIQDYEQSIAHKHFLVAAEGELIVAFGVLNQETNEIEALYTSPKVRGSGIGLRLLQELERRAQELGVRMLSLNASLNAVAFYEKAGYLRQEESTYRLATGVEIRCVPMTKSMS